jgi:hypothetical protein
MKFPTPFMSKTGRADREPRRPHRSRKLLVAFVALLTLGLAAGAWAYFRSTGSGSGQVSTGTLAGVSVAAVTGTPTTPLYPGATGDVILNIANSNTFSVKLVDVSANGTITADTGHSGCTTTGVTFTNQTALNVTVPANSSAFAVDLPGATSMSSASQSACQGATFTIQVKATVHTS